MGTFLKVFGGIGLVAVLVVVGVMVFSHSASGGYSPSDQKLDPLEISQNPYKYQGQSGILDTLNVRLMGSLGGRRISVPYPGGCLKFVNMLDEHTAAYEVRVGGEYGVESTDEIAVNLEDSNPPDPTRPWRVYVEGPTDITNGFGAAGMMGTVTFEGYYYPPPPPVQPVATPLSQQEVAPPEPPVQQVESQETKPLPPWEMSAQQAPKQEPVVQKVSSDYDWTIQADGLWELRNESGVCVTISGPTPGDSNIHVHYGNGVSGVFPSSEMVAVKDNARAYCQSLTSSR